MKVLSQKPLLNIYPELENSDDVTQDFIFMCPVIKSQINSSQSLLIGSLCFCLIDNYVKNLDIQSIKYLRDLFVQLEKQSEYQFIEQEIQQIKCMRALLSGIYKKLKSCQPCKKCQQCQKIEACETFSKQSLFENCDYLTNLEKEIFEKDKSNKAGLTFVEYFEFCASLILQERVANFAQINNSLQQQDIQNMLNIVFQADETQKELQAVNLQKSFELICKLFNIKGTIYYELNKNYLVKLGEYEDQQNDNLTAQQGYNIIFNNQFSSFRFGYCTLKNNELNMLKEKIYNQSDNLQILEQSLNISQNPRQFPDVQEKIQQAFQLQQLNQQIMEENEKLVENLNIYLSTNVNQNQQILDLQKQIAILESEIESIKIKYRV